MNNQLFLIDNSNRIKPKRIIISFGEVTQPILWEVHIYPLVKTHSILREKSTVLGRWYIILWEKRILSLGKKKHIYAMVNGT